MIFEKDWLSTHSSPPIRRATGGDKGENGIGNQRLELENEARGRGEAGTSDIATSGTEDAGRPGITSQSPSSRV